MFTASEHAAMIQATGGVVVTHIDESTYGHLETIPDEFGGIQSSGPSVVIPAGALSAIGPGKGIGQPVTVGGNLYYARAVTLENLDVDGGLVRVMLSGTSDV